MWDWFVYSSDAIILATTFGLIFASACIVVWLCTARSGAWTQKWIAIISVAIGKAVAVAAVATAIWLWEWGKRNYRRSADRVCEILRIPIDKRGRVSAALAEAGVYGNWSQFMRETGLPLKRPKGWKPKRGDIVRIREWNDMLEEFGVDAEGRINCRFRFTRSMADVLTGVMITIRTVDTNDGELYYNEDIGPYRLSVDMIEPV
jgi:hypothetical protein